MVKRLILFACVLMLLTTTVVTPVLAKPKDPILAGDYCRRNSKDYYEGSVIKVKGKYYICKGGSWVRTGVLKMSNNQATNPQTTTKVAAGGMNRSGTSYSQSDVRRVQR